MTGVPVSLKKSKKSKKSADNEGSSSPGLSHGTKTQKRTAKAFLSHILDENKKNLEIQSKSTITLAKVMKSLGMYLTTLTNSKNTDERPADTKLLNSVPLEGNTARDLINFCQSWLRISKDKIRYESRYDSFRTKLQGKGFGGQFDFYFNEKKQLAGNIASNEVLDAAIRELMEANKPTPTQSHDAFEDLEFQPRKESGHQFFIKFDELARDAYDGLPEDYQKAHLASLGKRLRSKILKGLREDGNEQKIQEFEIRFSNLKTEQDSTMAVATIVKELFPSLPPIFQSSTNVEEAETFAVSNGCFKCGGPHMKRDCPTQSHEKQSTDITGGSANDLDNGDYKRAMKLIREAGIKGWTVTKVLKSKVSHPLIVLSFIASPNTKVLVDPGCSHTVFFTKAKLDCSRLGSCIETVNHTLGGPRKTIFWDKKHEIDGITLPNIRVDLGQDFFIGGYKITYILGDDWLERCGSYTVQYELEGLSTRKRVVFGHKPWIMYELEREYATRNSIGKRTVTMTGQVHDVSSESPDLVVKPDVNTLEDADTMGVPPGARVVNEWKFSDLILKEVTIDGRPNRFVYEWIWKVSPDDPSFEKQLGSRFKGNILGKTDKVHLLKLAEVLKQWEADAIMVPVMRSEVLSTIAIMPVVQLHKSTPVRAVLNAIMLNRLINSSPKGDTVVVAESAEPIKLKPASCPHAIRMIRASTRPAEMISIDINKAFLQIFADFLQSFYQCLDVRGLGLAHEFYRLVRLPFGVSISPKVLKVAITIILVRAGVERDVIDYVDDLFMRKEFEPIVREALLKVGFTCKPAQPLEGGTILGMKVQNGKFKRARPIKAFDEILQGQEPKAKHVKSFVGGLAAHFPIAGQLRPMGIFLLRFQAEVEKAISSLTPSGSKRETHSKAEEKCRACNKPTKPFQKDFRKQNNAPVHPAVVAAIRKVEELILKSGDPVSGKFFYNMLGRMDLYTDASNECTAAILTMDGVKVEDGAWSRKRYWKVGDQLQHINVAELEAVVQGMLRNLSKHLAAKEEWRIRERRPKPAGKQEEVTIHCDNHSAVVWLQRALQEDADFQIPELSRKLASARVQKVVEFAKANNLKIEVVWISGKRNIADLVSRVPEPLLYIAKKFRELAANPSRLAASMGFDLEKIKVTDPSEPPLSQTADPADNHITDEASACRTGCVDRAHSGEATSDSDEEVTAELSVNRDTVYVPQELAAYEERGPGTIMVQDHSDCLISAAEPLSPVEDRSPVEASVSYWMDVAASQLPPKIAFKKRRAHSRLLARVKGKLICNSIQAADPVRSEFVYGADGKRVLANEADLVKILTVVHAAHQGSDELYKTVRTILSRESEWPEGGLRSKCRQFVGDCEACSMCKVKPANPESLNVELKNKQIEEIRRFLPLRFDANGLEEQPTAQDLQHARFIKAKLVKLLKLEKRQRNLLRFKQGTFLGEQVHMDVVGPWQFGGDKVYIVTLMDNFSSLAEAHWMSRCPTGADCREILKKFCNSTLQYVNTVVVDNGTQFTSKEFTSYIREIRARITYVGTYAHWANGKIERFHRTLNERVRCGIYAKMQETLAKKKRSGFNIVSVGIELPEVQRLLETVVRGWNASPRARQQASPHSLCSTSPDWVYPEIDEYRPKPIAKRSEDQVVSKRFGTDSTPAVGEVWTVRTKPGEHAVLAGEALPPKLKPTHKPGEIVQILDGGRYRVRIGSRIDNVVVKERNQLGKRLPKPRLAETRVTKTKPQHTTHEALQTRAQAPTCIESPAAAPPAGKMWPKGTLQSSGGKVESAVTEAVSTRSKRVRRPSALLKDADFVTDVTKRSRRR